MKGRSVSFQKHYSIPPQVSSPVLQIFGFCFIFFILYHFAPKAREYIFDFYAVIFVCLCFTFSPLSGMERTGMPERAQKRKAPVSGRSRVCIIFVKKNVFSPPVSSASARPVPGKGGTAAPRRCPDRCRQGAPRSGGCCRGACNSRSRRRR